MTISPVALVFSTAICGGSAGGMAWWTYGHGHRGGGCLHRGLVGTVTSRMSSLFSSGSRRARAMSVGAGTSVQLSGAHNRSLVSSEPQQSDSQSLFAIRVFFALYHYHLPV